MSDEAGVVWFVSAGPGDPELLTLKAQRRLAEADAVLFDDLAAGPILDHCRPDADLIGVGKRAKRNSPKQEHVSRLLVDYARAGAKVARLKSGDAGLFGRLEEEIEALEAAGIAFEIIPGVPSACAAAAAAAMPLSRRLMTRRVQICTGADVTGGLPQDLDWRALSDPAATTCVLMGKRTLPALVANLEAHGLPGDTPALLALAIGHPNERLWRGTLRGLIDELERHPSADPAVIIYGPLR